jgi:hypothetical protein
VLALPLICQNKARPIQAVKFDFNKTKKQKQNKKQNKKNKKW